MTLQFEWDPEKAARNVAKRGVQFEEAASVFADPLALIFDDAHHSGEPREILIGHSMENRLLLVCFTMRGQSIRLISARQATRQERREYEENV